MKISILIPMHNEAQKIRKTLQCLLSQDYPTEDVQYVIIDDNSTDNSVDIVKLLGINPILSNKQSWASNARNLGLLHCTGDVVLFLDAHLYLEDRNSFKIIRKTFQNNPTIGGICGKYTSATNTDWNLVRDIRRDAIFEKTSMRLISLRKFTTLSMAISAIRRELLDQVHFPDGFYDSFGEDTTFQLQAHHKKWDFLFTPELFGIHDSPQTASTILKKIVYELRGTANVLLYCKREKMEIPYLHFFLSYPLGRVLSIIIMIIDFKIGLGLFILCQALEITKIRKIFDTKYPLLMRIRAAWYSWLKELIGGIYVPWYIIKRSYNDPVLICSISQGLLKWEKEKMFSYLYNFSKK
ncbi:hypothetical protein COT94_03270 [Candidatus Falkowbacteria bacterium CG10_big_fil_rev_8_21_14_0_10_37_14]|uniref:Glycosyltransferase 2-like domain-containing protein n=1 Tax=Candidatus Falkowbacteria bacterium CG10_big_fil_rev_8_21_14_0_10_37_14 TaxID=1974561 RepID=A0A2M6WSX9_9BACT|nr:MAG: hypothetical protein COT94_03270 [Candidatus Falkowbacteria bacterium CG10_big_fil_rev_8_21_14_0_10_37_14]